MANNIFLTGDINVGKSTLLNRIADNLSQLNIVGFQTSRYYKSKKLEGFYIENIENEYPETEKKFIGRCINNDHWIAIPEVFDNYGVKLLEKALWQKPDIFVMDELGFFENDAVKFQNMVFNILDADIPVLGVIKQKDTNFLNMIRNREDVKIFEITWENRESMFYIIMEEF